MCDDFTLGSTSRACRSNDNDLWWLAGSSIAESYTEESSQVVGNVLLLLHVAVVEVNELVESFVDLVLVNFPILMHALSGALKLLAVEVLVNFLTIGFDAFD